jgi:hypothetical protein
MAPGTKNALVGRWFYTKNTLTLDERGKRIFGESGQVEADLGGGWYLLDMSNGDGRVVHVSDMKEWQFHFSKERFDEEPELYRLDFGPRARRSDAERT